MLEGYDGPFAVVAGASCEWAEPRSKSLTSAACVQLQRAVLTDDQLVLAQASEAVDEPLYVGDPVER
jgi:hypothetical protein